MNLEPIENGIILVDKPAGVTSFGVVARIRRRLSEHYEHKIKVGHTGTLDPFATGLMILVIGKECKNAGSYSKLDKVYEAEIVLGKSSTTGDPEGDIKDFASNVSSVDEVKAVINKFVGEIDQTPPRFSAIKVNGQRAYKLARKGEEFEMPKRRVKIYKIELLSYEYPTVKIRAEVSSGTYIRTLAEDMGEALGTKAYCSSLRRLSIDKWQVEDALKLKD